jgi:hypothetical protein
MTYLQVTEYPNATLQPGLLSNIVIGAASADVALSDGSDFSYLWLNARASLPGQVTQVSVRPPVLPSTARVYSVDVQVRFQTVPDATQLPLLLLSLCTQAGAITVSGQVAPAPTIDFSQSCPSDANGGIWETLDLGSFIAAPDGTPWDPTPVTGNLANLSCWLGRGDDLPADLFVSAISFTVNYQVPAVVTPTAPVSGSATQATATWGYASQTFSAQQAYRVGVYTLPQTLDPNFVPYVTPAQFISGAQGASPDTSWWQYGPAQQWTLPGDLTDGTYVAYIQAISQWAGAGGDFTTPIASITWTRTAAPAGPPNTAVLTSAAYSYSDMQTQMVIQPGTGGGAATTAFTVIKSTDGVSWKAASPSLTYIPANGLTPIPVADRYALLNAPTQYAVIAYSGSPLVAAAAPSTPLTVTPADNRWLLHHPTNDLLDTDFNVKSPKGDEGIVTTLLEMQGIYYYAGGPQAQALPDMTWGPVYGSQIALKMWFDMIARPGLWDAIEELRKARGPLFLQRPTGEAFWIGMGPGQTGQDVKDAENFVPGNQSKYQWKRRDVVLTQTNPPLVY